MGMSGALWLAVGLAAQGMAVLAAGTELRFPYPRFEQVADRVTDVEEAITHADRYRDLCVREAFGAQPYGPGTAAYATQAKGWYRRAEELEPQNAYAQLGLGYVSMVRGRARDGDRREYAQARAAFQVALERRPGYADAHRYLGELSALEARWAEAEKEFRLLLDSKIEDSHVYAWLGYVLYQEGKQDQAREYWRKARDFGRPAECAQYAAERLE